MSGATFVGLKLRLVFRCNYADILHHFWDIITYFPKFKDVTWP